MVGAIGSAGSLGGSAALNFNPTDATSMPEDQVQAQFGLAVLKSQLAMAQEQGATLARMVDPGKGGRVDALA